MQSPPQVSAALGIGTGIRAISQMKNLTKFHLTVHGYQPDFNLLSQLTVLQILVLQSWPLPYIAAQP